MWHGGKLVGLPRGNSRFFGVFGIICQRAYAVNFTSHWHHCQHHLYTLLLGTWSITVTRYMTYICTYTAHRNLADVGQCDYILKFAAIFIKGHLLHWKL